jgi:DNA-binding IclR family transcriptional regulator
LAKPSISGPHIIPSREKRTGTIQSISIAAKFLNTLSASPGPLALSVLARETGTGLSTAHRYMQSLIKEGFATQDASSGLYDLGPTALYVGVSAVKRIEPIDIAAGHMKALAQAHAVSGGVAIWTERGPTLVRWFRSADFSISSLGLGDVLPLDNTACGLMFQAFLAQPVIEKARMTQPASFRGTAPSREMLADIRKEQWAERTSHLIPGVTGQAAPIFDAQGELVCVMTTVTDLGQSRSPSDRDALRDAAAAANHQTAGSR